MKEQSLLPTPVEEQPEDPAKVRTILRWVWDTAVMIGLAIAIVWPIRAYVAQPFFVRGASMTPTFQDGEYLIIDQLSYNIGLRTPTRGDVIVFRYPLDPSQYYIKRIIGMPGEQISIRDGSVLITKNGKSEQVLLPEPYIPNTIKTAGAIDIALKEDEYFVMGDNRTHSSDSRAWGALSSSLIVGRAFFRAFPVARAGTVTGPQYGAIPPIAIESP